MAITLGNEKTVTGLPSNNIGIGRYTALVGVAGSTDNSIFPITHHFESLSLGATIVENTAGSLADTESSGVNGGDNYFIHLTDTVVIMLLRRIRF